MLELRKIYKTYITKKGKKNEVLKDISLKFENKGMTFILGKSGSGKSTLLNLIGGLDKYDKGDMLILEESTKNFKSKDFDTYRNNYIGFVFQEFNIIEDYTVYENIILALELQDKKVDSNEIDRLLKKLEIEEFKERKVNELSGGQKQRVAIARALIKKPKIILADEPTGNLDSNTGSQVMDLLKEISKDTLVIVVSHNVDYAKEYNDRIIEIEDGIITNDSNIIDYVSSNEKYSISKTKLPLKDAFKLGFFSLRSKKLKLFFTISLISFSTIFLSLAYIIRTYDVAENHFKLIKDNNIDTFEINKEIYSGDSLSDDYSKRIKYINSEDISIISNKIDDEVYPIYILNETSKSLNEVLNINIKIGDILNGTSIDHDMYTNFSYRIQIVELNSSDDLIEEKIIGFFPKENDEINISDYIADLIIKYGIYEYGTERLYYPKSYEELVNSNKEFSFGSNNYAKIVGVIEYDLSKYNVLKEKFTAKNSSNNALINLQFELLRQADTIHNKIYVKNGFINNLNKKEINSLINDNQYIAQIGTTELSCNNKAILKEVEYYDGSGWKKTGSLKEGEMLLDLSNITTDYWDYIEKLTDYVAKYPHEDKLELEKEFVLDYIDDSYVGQTVSLDIYEDIGIRLMIKDSEPTKSYKNIKIVGITGLSYSETNGNLFSEKIVGKYVDFYVKTYGVMIRTNSQSKIKNLLKIFPYNGEYSTNTTYSSEVESYNLHIITFKPYVDIATIVFLIFSIILICNFMFNSISSRKKDIGILKSLGATNSDVIKIFLIEGILLSLISSILSIIASFFAFELLNNTTMSVANLIISPFYVSANLAIVTFIYISVVVSLSSIIPLLKISKMKPIDAIYNR